MLYILVAIASGFAAALLTRWWMQYDVYRYVNSVMHDHEAALVNSLHPRGSLNRALYDAQREIH